jgi:phage FluMu protein Com
MNNRISTRQHSVPSGELRCKCNRLLARVSRTEVILKCPRCKKQAVLSLAENKSNVEIDVKFIK